MEPTSNQPDNRTQPIVIPTSSGPSKSPQTHKLPTTAPQNLSPQDKRIFETLMQIATQAGQSVEQTKHNKAMKDKLEEAVKDDTVGVGVLSPELAHEISLVAQNIPA